MKYVFIFSLLLSSLTDPTKIGRIKKIKAEAKKAYLAGDFKVAASKYQYMIDSLEVDEDEVRLNLANAYFNLKDTSNALGHYQALSQSDAGQIRSKAETQLGVMANRTSKFEEALNHFKQAIKADPSNMDARYNYELLKKKLEEEKKKQQQQQDQNKDKEDRKDQQKEKQDQKKDQQDQNKDEKNKDQKDADQKKDEQKNKEQQEQKEKEDDSEKDKKENQELPQSIKDKLKDMKISEEKAKMILEAMKNQEKQYLQQNKRKATKPRQKGKPDW
jgi:hypothetical protein